MDISFWTIGGAVAVVGLILLRAALLWGKRPSGPRMSPRLKRVQELRRRIEEKEAQREAKAAASQPDPEPPRDP